MKRDQIQLTARHFEIIFQHFAIYTRTTQIDVFPQVEMFLERMKSHKIQPNASIFESIFHCIAALLPVSLPRAHALFSFYHSFLLSHPLFYSFSLYNLLIPLCISLENYHTKRKHFIKIY